jgi:hypothetical protein
VATTAEQMSEAFQTRREALEEELGIDIRVELVMAHLGKAKANMDEDIFDLLRKSVAISELRESIPVIDRVYDELRRVPMPEAQRGGMIVLHQNRGGGVHLVRVELPREAAECVEDQVARDVAGYLQRLAPRTRGRRPASSPLPGKSIAPARCGAKPPQGRLFGTGLQY